MRRRTDSDTMSDEITLSMTLNEFNRQKEMSFQDGFENGKSVLLDLIRYYTKSELSPIKYLKSIEPKKPNRVLYEYFQIVEPEWLKNET